MPALPDGDDAPLDGRLPGTVLAGATERAFGVYLHVPFCVRRCGYCDFNTYTAAELGQAQIGQAQIGGARIGQLQTGQPQTGAVSTVQQYLTAAHAELELAAQVLASADLPSRAVSTVFIGGGTPTMLEPAALVGLLAGVRTRFGLTPDAEVTTEANPDSVTADSLAALAAGGFTRVSFGMQSAVPQVLATLDRTHDPERIAQVVQWAREAGLAVSLDLIYGTPGESMDDWATSVDAALATRPDHVSAYALTVEPGTALARRVRRGEVDPPEGDDQAAKYELADDRFAAAGYHWYEVSNWAFGPGVEESAQRRCRHNLAYWRSDDWWGVGPGAHSHIGGVRWWNVKHPKAFAERLAAGHSPAAGRETLDEATRTLEDLLLQVRLRQGWRWRADGRREAVVDRLADDGLVTQRNPLVLSRRGRLLADHVVRELVD